VVVGQRDLAIQWRVQQVICLAQSTATPAGELMRAVMYLRLSNFAGEMADQYWAVEKARTRT
jgi:hypothetical protein